MARLPQPTPVESTAASRKTGGADGAHDFFAAHAADHVADMPERPSGARLARTFCEVTNSRGLSGTVEVELAQ